MRKLLQQKPTLDIEVLALSIDTHEQSKELLGKLEAQPMSDADIVPLEDAGHRVTDRYGLLNPEADGLPHPATFVIDKTGIVRWKFVEPNYRVRPTNDMILNALNQLP